MNQRVTRTQRDLIARLQEHCVILEDFHKRACREGQTRYLGEIAGKLRVLVHQARTNRALLLVRLLGEGWSANKICKWCHVTRETVRAVERREATEISARKKSIVGILGNVAELGAARMEETIGEASLRDATIGTGVAIDKILALTGQMPAVNIANIWMPSEEERQEMRETDRKLDEITARLMALDTLERDKL
jgi:hypothetical protein